MASVDLEPTHGSRNSLRGITRGVVKTVRCSEDPRAHPCWVFLDPLNVDVLLLALSPTFTWSGFIVGKVSLP